MKVKELIIGSFELFIKKQRLKHIDKELDKYYNAEYKSQCQAHIVRKMINRYNELYPDDKIDLS